MSWDDQYDDEQRGLEQDDNTVDLDVLMKGSGRRRSWADERKPTRDMPLPVADKVTNQRGRAYWKGLPSTLTRDEWVRWRRAFGKCCAYCGDQQAEPIMDHVVSIAQGGGTTIYNVMPACRQCNSKKRDMSPWRWFSIIGWEPFLERYARALETMNEKA